MNKHKSFFKLKHYLIFLGTASATGLTVFAASCSTPTESTVKNLFVPADRFGDALFGLDTSNMVGTILSDSTAFTAFLDAAMGDVLVAYYENSPFKNVKDNFKEWKETVDTTWDNRVQSSRNQYRQDFQVRLQTDVLDAAGGTEASWKQNELGQRALSQFKTELFADYYLNMVDDKGQIITKPSLAQLDNQDNWKNIKYTNQTTDKKYNFDATSSEADAKANDLNNKQMFADIQDFVSKEWVKQENPNLVSRVVFTNETPEVGFNSIFNSEVISDISASYEFQMFNPSTGSSRNPTGSYIEMVANAGLSKYVNPNNNTIDIPNYLSSDSGGKLLMSASDMFSTFDPAFSAAYVDQYAAMKDANSATALLGQAVNLDATNIMNNFIRKPSNGSSPKDPESAYTTLDYVTEKKPEDKKLFTETAKTIANGYYKNYADLQASTDQTKIFEVIKPATKTTNSGSGTSTDESNQFILARGKDGVHVMAIDGGKGYITSSGRDVDKQRGFLLFRTMYDLLGYESTNLDYSFNASTTMKDFFDKKSSLLLYQAFEQALTDQQSFLHLKVNEKLKEKFETLSNQVKAYVNSMTKLMTATTLQATVESIRIKMKERSATYLENDKTEQSFKNGIAAKFPNVQAADGSYPSLENYYVDLAKDVGIATKANSATTTTGTRDFFNNLTVSLKKQVKEEAVKLAQSLNLQRNDVSKYSQVIILKSDTNDQFSLPVNLAINSGISSTTLTDTVKSKFFANSNIFKDIYDFSTGKLKTTDGKYSKIATDLQTVTDYYYGLSLLSSNSLGNSAYGVPEKGKFDSLVKILETVVSDQKFKDDPNSAQAINYFTFIYTLEWLIRDDLKQFKTILNSQIYEGSAGLVSWTVPVDVGANLSSNNPIETFDNNPNYFWGAPSNWLNSTNGVDKANKANTLSNPYRATNIKNGTTSTSSSSKTRFGFNGLSVQGDNKVDSALESALYTDFAKSKSNGETVSTGALYAYGSSRDEVKKYIDDNLQSNRDLDNFISYLVDYVGLSITDDKLLPSNQDVTTKKAKLLEYVQNATNNNNNNIPDVAFQSYSGYIGEAKSTDNIANSKPIQTADGKHKLPTYVKQVNYKDVSMLGGTNGAWMDASNSSNRLGLDLQELLPIIAIQALDTGTQSSAITDLINKNKNEDGSSGRIAVGDKRLFDALTSRWVKSINSSSN